MGMRRIRGIVAVLAIAGLLGAIAGCTAPEPDPAASGPTAVVVTVEGDKKPTVAAADLGAPERAGIESIASIAGEGGIVFGTPIEIDMEGELPEGGAILTRTYAAPLPDGSAATFAYWDEEGAAWSAVPTTLSDDRITITATVTHFSTWLEVVVANTRSGFNSVVDAASSAGQAVATWTTQAVTTAAEATLWSYGNIASVRVELPECDGTPPIWVTTHTLQDDPTHPVRLCVGHDSQDPDLLVVKARSNRAYGFSVDLTVNPAWEYNSTGENNLATVISTIGGVDAAIGQSVAELLNQGRFVGGGEEISFGLPASAFRDYGADHLLRLSPPSIPQFLLSTLAQEIVASGISKVDGVLGAAIVVASCASAYSRITDIGNASSAIVTCVSSMADQGASTLTNALIKVGREQGAAFTAAKKMLGRASMVFAIFSGGAAAIDYSLENVAYSDADRTVQVTVDNDAVEPLDRTDTSTWIISAAGIGPVKLGMDPDQVGAALAPTFEVIDRCEDITLYTRTDGTSSLSLFTGGDRAVTVRVPLGSAVGADSPHTEEGIKVGSTIDDVTRAYPNAAVNTDEFYTTYVIPAGAGWITFSLEAGESTVRAISVALDQPPAGYCS